MKSTRSAGVVAMSVLTIWLLTVCGPTSPGQAQAVRSDQKQDQKPGDLVQSPMVGWEYKTSIISKTDTQIGEWNELGRKGWELAGIVDEPRNQLRGVFKRPKQK